MKIAIIAAKLGCAVPTQLPPKLVDAKVGELWDRGSSARPRVLIAAPTVPLAALEHVDQDFTRLPPARLGLVEAKVGERWLRSSTARLRAFAQIVSTSCPLPALEHVDQDFARLPCHWLDWVLLTPRSESLTKGSTVRPLALAFIASVQIATG